MIAVHVVATAVVESDGQAVVAAAVLEAEIVPVAEVGAVEVDTENAEADAEAEDAQAEAEIVEAVDGVEAEVAEDVGRVESADEEAVLETEVAESVEEESVGRLEAEAETEVAAVVDREVEAAEAEADAPWLRYLRENISFVYKEYLLWDNIPFVTSFKKIYFDEYTTCNILNNLKFRNGLQHHCKYFF